MVMSGSSIAAKPDDHLQQVLDKVSHIATAAPEWLNIIIENGGPRDSLENITESKGGQIRYQQQDRYEIRIPANRAGELLSHLSANSIARLPFPHAANTVTGAGVTFTGGSDMHTLGFDGAGIRIGIIDLGFGGLAGSQASGELPATGAGGLSITDYTGTGTGGTSHGTNIAEIIHDMAPGAELKLAKIDSELQLDTAVRNMAAVNQNQRVHVIVHAVSWFGAAFYDGTGSLCTTANIAESNGVLWVNSAGNWRNKHYLGTFTDNGSGRHLFGSGQSYTTVSLTAGTPASFTLNWDAYPTTTVDYNLYLYNGVPSAGGNVVASSQNSQSGTIPNYYPYPYEYLSHTPTSSGIYYLVVEKAGGTISNLPLTLFSPQADLGSGTTASSLAQPADCSTVLAVGASQVLTDTLKSYSSEGPTTDGRNKPEITGPADVQTSLTSSFGGTSAAAPHIAAAAGLLRDQNSALTLAQLRAALTDSTVDLSTPGFDFRTGNGRLSLDADGDSLNHDFELAIGTNSTLTDTDGDNLTDDYEVNYDNDPAYTPGQDLDPTQADTDGDGLSDDVDPEPLSGVIPGDLAPRSAPDGVINIADYLVAQRIVLGLITPTGQELATGDLYVTGASAGVIDMSDLLVLQGMVLP